jgi:hypothetical protein
MKRATLEVDWWKQVLIIRVKHMGANSLDVARGLVQLGAAHIRNKVYFLDKKLLYTSSTLDRGYG